MKRYLFSSTHTVCEHLSFYFTLALHFQYTIAITRPPMFFWIASWCVIRPWLVEMTTAPVTVGTTWIANGSSSAALSGLLLMTATLFKHIFSTLKLFFDTFFATICPSFISKDKNCSLMFDLATEIFLLLLTKSSFTTFVIPSIFYFVNQFRIVTSVFSTKLLCMLILENFVRASALLATTYRQMFFTVKCNSLGCVALRISWSVGCTATIFREPHSQAFSSIHSLLRIA